MDRVLSRCTVSHTVLEARFFFPLLVLSCPFSLTPSLFSRPLSIWRPPGWRPTSGSRVSLSLSPLRREARRRRRRDGGAWPEAVLTRGNKCGGVGAPPLLPAHLAATVPPRRCHREARLCACHQTRRTRYIDRIPSLCACRRSDPFSMRNAARRNTGGAHRVVHGRGRVQGGGGRNPRRRPRQEPLRVGTGRRHRVRGGVKRGTTTGRGGGGADSTSTTTIRSSNSNPMAGCF
jgi:hypothetical protein